MEPSIIYQDKEILILDKPPSWVVNDSASAKNLNILQDFLMKNFDYEISQDRELRSGIVHRLDKDTSGVLLVAKTKEMFLSLQSQFKERKVQKVYLALAHGKFTDKKGIIDAPVGRSVWNRRKFTVVPGGREAVTEYKVLDTYQKDKADFSLLELYPKTGRTHQIRVHLKHIGHPIVADRTYVGRKNWRHDSAWCPRVFLHAQKITFTYPETVIKTSFEAQLPEDLVGALKQLTKTS